MPGPLDAALTATPGPRQDGRVRRWYMQMLLINLIEFTGESTRGIAMATLYSLDLSLGKDASFLGPLTSVFSAWRFLASLSLGWLCDRYPFKHVSCIMGIWATCCSYWPMHRSQTAAACYFWQPTVAPCAAPTWLRSPRFINGFHIS